ncbi:segregation and condensation protein A [Paraneptunicella aestuarii]|uniref:segregation and condensation protein A n=1 Tax=Paraneptunicella aestuarii TaxID=2831148 RepID=UPI0038CDBD37
MTELKSSLPVSQEPVQQPLPLAFVNGLAVIEKPEDLYIPPDALEVILEAFEGPLDLLLYLIRKQKFDIVNLPVLEITKQYMEYVDVMKDIKLELAGEYLVMAAILAEIKSRVLLPRRESEEEEEDDPRAELIRRLKEYEVIKVAAQELDGIPRQERDFFAASAVAAESCKAIKVLPDVTLQELVLSFQQAMQRAASFEHHHIQKETLSTRERMSMILGVVGESAFTEFADLFTPEEGKAGVVVTFLAILELVKEKLVEVVQAEPYSHIHVRLQNAVVVDL